MKNQLRNGLRITLAGIVLALAPAFAQDNFRQLPSLAKLLAPISYPLLSPKPTANAIEQRFREITKDAQSDCAKKYLIACLWVASVEELQDVSQKLHSNSPKPSLFLSLAARTYSRPAFAENPSDQLESFDSLYGRYLMGLRIVRALWPKIRQSLHYNSQLDPFVEAWLSTGNGWTFATETLKSLQCPEKADDCVLEESLSRTLKAAVQRVDEDPKLANLANAGPEQNYERLLRIFRAQDRKAAEDAADQANIARREQEIQNILASTLESEENNYFFSDNQILDQERLTGMQNYLSNMRKGEGTVPLLRPFIPTGNSCADFKKVVEAAKEMNLSFVSRLQNVPCENKEKIISQLKQDGMLEDFQLLQIRLSIYNFYGDNLAITDEQIHFRMDQRNVRELVEAIRWIRSLPDHPLDRYENNDWTKFLLLNFYQTAEGMP
jgi:hypothetical protein